MFCLPLEAGDLSTPVQDLGVRLPLPSVSFHMSEPKQTLRVAEGTFPHVASEHSPFGSAGLRCRAD